MKSYSAIATREGSWWVVDVTDVGVTQGRNAREAERMAVDLVALMLDVPTEEVSVNVEFVLGGELATEVKQVKQAQRQAEKVQEQAADKSRAVVRRVLAAGLSKQDAARVLGVSAQRISQLAPEVVQKNPGSGKTREPLKQAKDKQPRSTSAVKRMPTADRSRARRG